MKYQILAFLVVASFVLSCTTDIDYAPKPRSFPRIDFPEKSYQTFDEDYCNFTFEYPTYAKIEQDTDFFDGKSKHECWFDIVIPELNGKIHCSYYPIETDTSFDKLMTDAFKLANEHTVKAEYIDEFIVQKPNGVSGFIFEIDGPVASPFQFFLTDSTDHFLRGAIYIRDKANPDSLKPVYEYLKMDASMLVNSFEWKK